MSIILSPTRGQRRQTVLNGPSVFALNSYAGGLFAVTGLTGYVDGRNTAVVVSFAAGFGPRGEIDYIVRRKALDAVSLTPNATNYLYYERNPNTGVISLGATIAAADYGPYPSQVAVNAVWFSTVDFVMRIYNGSTWLPVQRVYLGEIVTNASAGINSRTYAYNGQYLSPATLIAGSSTYSFSHNLGMPLTQTLITVYGIGTNTTGGASIQHDQFTFNSASYGYLGQGPTRNDYVITTAVNPAIGSAIGQWDTSGTYWLRAERAF